MFRGYKVYDTGTYRPGLCQVHGHSSQERCRVAPPWMVNVDGALDQFFFSGPADRCVCVWFRTPESVDHLPLLEVETLKAGDRGHVIG